MQRSAVTRSPCVPSMRQRKPNKRVANDRASRVGQATAAATSSGPAIMHACTTKGRRHGFETNPLPHEPTLSRRGRTRCRAGRGHDACGRIDAGRRSQRQAERPPYDDCHSGSLPARKTSAQDRRGTASRALIRRSSRWMRRCARPWRRVRQCAAGAPPFSYVVATLSEFDIFDAMSNIVAGERLFSWTVQLELRAENQN